MSTTFSVSPQTHCKNTFIGVVLAGGQSIRMGQDKSQLSLNGKTQIQRCYEMLLETSSIKSVFVSHNQGHGIPDLIPNKGPLGGIYSALKLQKSDVLVLPVDMPFVDFQSLRSLIQEHTRNVQLCKCDITFSQESLFPMVINYSAEIVSILESMLTTAGSTSVNRFIHMVNNKSSAVIQSNQRFNMNTLDAYRHAIAKLQE